MKKRIWELDALRGLCILGMLIVHFVYDLVELSGLVSWQYPALFSFVKDWGGVLFLLISGVCVTLGSHSIRRGFLVFSFGMVCTLVTGILAVTGLADEGIVIWFGVLHCLGACMLLWPLFQKMPVRALAVTGIVLAALGLILQKYVRVDFPWLIPLGFLFLGFRSSDYFPLLPHLGFFLLGAVLGKTLYREKKTLFPKVNENTPILRFLQKCGRHSLWIYLLHQPVLAGLMVVLTFFIK